MISLELYKRIISSIVLVPITFYIILKGSILFSSFLIICFLFAAYEWHSMKQKIQILQDYPLS